LAGNLGLRQYFVDVLFAVENPQAESVLPPVVDGPVEAFPAGLFRKGLAISGGNVSHYLGIGMEAVEIGEVQWGDGLSEEAGGG